MNVEDIRKALAERNPKSPLSPTPHSVASPVPLNLTHKIELRVCQHCPRCGFDLDIPTADIKVLSGFSYVPGPKKVKEKPKKVVFSSQMDDGVVEL